MRFALLLILLFLPCSLSAFNKQYHQLRWQEVNTRYFRVIYHDEMEKSLPALLGILEQQFTRLKDLFEIHPRRRLEIVLKSFADEDRSYIDYKNNQIHLFLTGDFSLNRSSNFSRKSGALLCKHFIFRLLGQSQTPIVRKSRFLALPEWFIEGFSAFLFAELSELDRINILRSYENRTIPGLSALANFKNRRKRTKETLKTTSLAFVQFLFTGKSTGFIRAFLKYLGRDNYFFLTVFEKRFNNSPYYYYQQFLDSLKKEIEDNFPDRLAKRRKIFIPGKQSQKNARLSRKGEGVYFLEDRK
ncbi:hypothetical protein ACFL35_16740, partial [Candidatus Riflebacteria bacterium]